MEALSRYVPVGLQAVARDARVALAFQIVGALWVSIVLARTLTALVLASLLRAITRRPVRSYGEWAVVTGATDVRLAAKSAFRTTDDLPSYSDVILSLDQILLRRVSARRTPLSLRGAE